MTPIKYDMVFVSYTVNQCCGVKIAHVLRQRKIENIIIMGNSPSDFMIDVFEISSFRYLFKPITTQKIIKVLEDYFAQYGNDYNVLLKSNRETVCVNTKNIVFLEADNKHCFVHLRQGTIRCAKTLNSISNSLTNNHFCKVHRAFVINFNYVSRYNRESISLKSGDSIPVGGHYWRDFKNTFQDYAEQNRISHT